MITNYHFEIYRLCKTQQSESYLKVDRSEKALR